VQFSDAERKTQRPSSVTVRHALQILRTCGFVRLRRVFAPRLLRTVDAAVVRLFKSSEKERRELATVLHGNGGRDELSLPFRAPFNRADLLDSPYVSAIVSQYLGKQFKLENAAVIVAQPGATAQPFHKDWAHLFPEKQQQQQPPVALKVSVPLVPVTHAMGPTQLCPATHKVFGRRVACNRPVSFATELGDVVLYDYQVNHRGPPNPSAKRRPVLDLTYSALWFTDAARPASDRQLVEQRRFWRLFALRPDQPGGFLKKKKK
jgi:ectoine hydroxylase-related dioxygenase (phytanoyl-CoA dioxygenase family)